MVLLRASYIAPLTPWPRGRSRKLTRRRASTKKGKRPVTSRPATAKLLRRRDYPRIGARAPMVLSSSAPHQRLLPKLAFAPSVHRSSRLHTSFGASWRRTRPPRRLEALRLGLPIRQLLLRTPHSSTACGVRRCDASPCCCSKRRTASVARCACRQRQTPGQSPSGAYARRSPSRRASAHPLQGRRRGA